MSSFLENNCLNVYWKIKNFSYCLEKITSPVLKFKDGQHCLKLYPKDIKCQIVCFEFIGRRHESKISFLTCDGSPQESVSNRDCLQTSKSIIFGKRRNAFLPNDTLTIVCQFPTAYNRGKVSIQSQIGVKRKCFLWRLENFNPERENNNSLLVEKCDQYGDMELKLKSVDGINSDEKFYIEISKSGGQKCYCFLKVSVLDKDGKALNHVSDEFVFEKEVLEFWKFPPIIRKSKLLACKSLMLPNNTLSLKCDFSVTLGKESDQTVVYSYNEDIVPLLKDSGDLSVCFKDDSCLEDLKTDLKCILDNETLCDVSLQVGSNVIQVHKNILSARSPVFKAMFTNDMKEKINNTVVIEDLDVETVRRLLLYMYTDTITDYQGENIMNMYLAADKYEVLSLKQKCSTYLRDNITVLNVCEILVLADLHQDADLKSVVLEFLSIYYSEVFASEAWKELEKNNSSLAFQTLREMYPKNRLD